MPRTSRESIKSNFIHIVTKGLAGEFIFYKKEYKDKYISLLNQKLENGIQLISYCVMDNHAHILMYMEDIKILEKFMKKLNTAYAIFYNSKEERKGYVFATRYYSQIIKNERHLLQCIHYIHKNPVNAGIVSIPKNYKYSSCNAIMNGKMRAEILKIVFGENFYCMYTEADTEENCNFIDENLQNKITEKKDIEDIINEFCNKKGKTMKQIKQSNKLIIELKEYLNINYKVSNKNICAILGIGKNRITLIERKLKKD